jgi:hypothetical protein
MTRSWWIIAGCFVTGAAAAGAYVWIKLLAGAFTHGWLM